MAKRISYKNHCTPQEQISSGGKYYRDSDCGRKLTGDYTFTLDGGTTAYTLSELVTSTPRGIASGQNFVFIKNTGDSDVYISLNNNYSYKAKLLKNESLAVELEQTTGNNVYVKTDSGLTSTIEYLKAT